MKAVKQFFKKYENIFYPLISLVLFIAVWAIYAHSVGIEMIIPTPKATFSEFFALMSESYFWEAVGNTLLRVLYSFLLSFLIAIVLAVIGAIVRPINKLLEPIITILRATPTMSIILLAVIWFKSTESPIFIAFLLVFPICYTAFYSAIVNVDKELIELSKVYKVKKFHMVTKLYIPYIAPTLFSTAKTAISLNVKVVIAAEVLAQTFESMGINMQISRINLDTAELMAWTLMAIVLSFLLESIVDILKKLTMRWQNAD